MNEAGKCNWCGTDGWCCAKSVIKNGCDGTFGGDDVHRCVLKPKGDKKIFFLFTLLVV